MQKYARTGQTKPPYAGCIDHVAIALPEGLPTTDTYALLGQILEAHKQKPLTIMLDKATVNLFYTQGAMPEESREFFETLKGEGLDIQFKSTVGLFGEHEKKSLRKNYLDTLDFRHMNNRRTTTIWMPGDVILTKKKKTTKN